MQHHPRTARLPAPPAADVDGPDAATISTAPVDPSLAGTVLGGRYRIGECIGAGAMGVVWTAWDQRLRRTVAVKQLIGSAASRHAAPGDAAPARVVRARALREGRIAARVVHSRAIAVFDVVASGGTSEAPWLVMEYLPSRSLAAVLAEHGPLEPAQAAHVGAQIADALAAVHAAGIVHGDVKPGNVLIGADGLAKITDFGVSRASWDTTATGGGPAAGTPGYVAPEVARGDDPSTASDVFSLGATLYAAVEGELVCGSQPNPLAALHAMAEGHLRPATRAGVLSRPLASALRVDAEHRPDMRAFHRILRTRAAATPSSVLDVRPSEAPGSSRTWGTSAAQAPAPAEPAPSEPASAEPATSLEAPSEAPSKAPSKAPSEAPSKAPPAAAVAAAVAAVPAARTPARPEQPREQRSGKSPEQRPDRRPGGGGRVVLVAAAAAVALGVGAGATFAGPTVLTRLTGSGTTTHAAAPGRAAQPSAPVPDTAVRDTAVPETSLPETSLPADPGTSTGSTEAPSVAPPVSPGPSDPAEPGAPVSADDVGRTVSDYYGSLPGDLDTAWATLSDQARDESGGYDGYRTFWHGITDVSADDVQVDGTGATAAITFVTADGRTSRETYRFEVGRSDDGHLQIESARRAPSSE